ncbi:MAG TPA: hypothetical protein VLA04_00730 [Verrucomicrobiae bacterium]|nr:hypothetical protein [Verrucomicrobiae bacterium]
MENWKKKVVEWYFRSHPFENEALYEKLGVRTYWRYGINGGRRTTLAEFKRFGCAVAMLRLRDPYGLISTTEYVEGTHLRSLAVAIIFSLVCILAHLSFIAAILFPLAVIFDLCPILEQRWIRLRCHRLHAALLERDIQKPGTASKLPYVVRKFRLQTGVETVAA